MIKSRGTYFILIFFTIIIGLLSREFKVVPLFAGDILWALMVYFLVRFLLIDKPISIVIITSLLFCYFIEFSQLYKAPWIDSLRHTVFGRLVLGETFLWGDILSYTIGIGIGGLVDSWILKLKS
ncbi:MAG: hypothetical protein JWP44_2472 [Mucilaginibacter sp.]|nr:hypothetical protein [Mucilaginibacter sp.]